MPISCRRSHAVHPVLQRAADSCAYTMCIASQCSAGDMEPQAPVSSRTRAGQPDMVRGIAGHLCHGDILLLVQLHGALACNASARRLHSKNVLVECCTSVCLVLALPCTCHARPHMLICCTRSPASGMDYECRQRRSRSCQRSLNDRHHTCCHEHGHGLSLESLKFNKHSCIRSVALGVVDFSQHRQRLNSMLPALALAVATDDPHLERRLPTGRSTRTNSVMGCSQARPPLLCYAQKWLSLQAC